MVSRILFPSDGSRASDEAFKQLVPLASALKAQVTLFHDYALLSVTHSEVLEACETSGATLDELESALKAKGRELLELQGQQLAASGVSFDLVQVRGHTGERIVEMAQNLQIDLIMMGSRGLNSLDSFLLGSTSLHVLHNSRCPVLIIPCPA